MRKYKSPKLGRSDTCVTDIPVNDKIGIGPTGNQSVYLVRYISCNNNVYKIHVVETTLDLVP